MRRRLCGSLSFATSLGTLDRRAGPAAAVTLKGCDDNIVDPAAASATFSFSFLLMSESGLRSSKGSCAGVSLTTVEGAGTSSSSFISIMPRGLRLARAGVMASSSMMIVDWRDPAAAIAVVGNSRG